MSSATLPVSPMMAQWHACKQSAPGTILLFRLGDFYEAFHDDAVVLAKELDLTLTKRQEVPMSGVPFHASEAYIDRLVAKGYRVAIAEQMEDPKLTKGLVKRAIVRIVTPGTVVTSSLLTDKSNNFIAALTQLNAIFGLAILDLTTADFRVVELEDKKGLLDELARLRPAEIFISEKCRKNLPELGEEFARVLNLQEEWRFDHRTACERLLKHFQVQTLDGFGLKGMSAAINAAGALLTYVHEDLNLPIAHIKTIRLERLSAYMAIDRTTQRHLELDKLQELLDHTQTPMGGRLLKQWLNHPLLAVEQIHLRQEAIAALLSQPQLCAALVVHMEQIRDLERLCMRIVTGYASPRDLSGLRYSLEHVGPIADLLRPCTATLIAEDVGQLGDVAPLIELIETAIVDAPPLRLSEGGIFKAGYNAELDELRTLKSDSHTWIAQYQTTLRAQTDIRTLKVGFTKAFGFYIEVSRGQAGKQLPETFQRRQTLVNAERFITPELKDYEHKVLSAEERTATLENILFHSLREKVASFATLIRAIAQAIARLDTLLSLAQAARKCRCVKPLVDDGELLRIEDGRHPVIEASLASGTFIPNDTHLDQQQNRLFLITGPNMAGKSTYIRQVALIAIMAQIGAFVPAEHAHIGIIDKVFSRIGASDDLARGQSTFMVEMSETANILHNATDRSLVILDEIGRGTSTYDGIAIAWAVAEFLLTQPGKMAKTLFATHYWELTQLAEQIPGAVNYNVAVHESQDKIIFLRKIIKGGTDKSYGIHVAKLAGLPAVALKRAQEMLAKLETRTPPNKTKQLELFQATPSAADTILAELRQLDLDQLTPFDALRKLAEWKEVL